MFNNMKKMLGGGGGGGSSQSASSDSSLKGTLFEATGGIVPKYASTGMFVPRGTDTVPAMLTPGELVLNAAQQKNLVGKMGSTIINIYGTISSRGVAEEYADLIVRKLQLSTKVV